MDVLESISRLADPRDVRNPRVTLEYEKLLPSSAMVRKSGRMKLSQFLTLYATNQAKSLRLGDTDDRIHCRFRNVSISDPCRHLEANDFRWEDILQEVGGEDLEERLRLEDFEILVRWKILSVRPPFDPDDIPTYPLKDEAVDLWKMCTDMRIVCAEEVDFPVGFFTPKPPEDCDSDPEVEVFLGSDVEAEENEEFARAEAWWTEAESVLEQRDRLKKQYDILAGKRGDARGSTEAKRKGP